MFLARPSSPAIPFFATGRLRAPVLEAVPFFFGPRLFLEELDCDFPGAPCLRLPARDPFLLDEAFGDWRNFASADFVLTLPIFLADSF